MKDATIQILLVEPSATDALLLESELADSSFGPFLMVRVTSLQEAILHLQVQRFDVLLLDLQLSDDQSHLSLEQIHEYAPDLAVVVLTGIGEQLLGIRAMKEGAEDYLVKSGARDTLRGICYAIERKRSNGARLAAEQQLALAVDAAALSIYEWTIQNDKVHWSFQQSLLFGLLRDEFPGTLEAFALCVHPDDRAGIRLAIDKSVADHGDFFYQYRVVWPDGSVHWLEGRGKVFDDDQGIAVRMVGTVINITQQKAASEVEITRKIESNRLSQANLTPRELTLLKLIASGLPNKRIAFDLNISIKTVAKHRSHLMTKTKALNAADLARITAIAGLFAND